MNYPRTGLHSEHQVRQQGISFPVIDEVKAFILCFIYYAKDHSPIESTPWERSHAAAAANEIIKKMCKIHIWPDDIITYYEMAIANAKKSSILDWNEDTVAMFLVGQIKKEDGVRAITTFNLKRDLVSSGFIMALIVSANCSLKVAGLSRETVRVLEHVQYLSRKNQDNGVWTAWNSFTEGPHCGGSVSIVDPPLFAIDADPASSLFSSTNQVAAVADCTLDESPSDAPEGSVSWERGRLWQSGVRSDVRHWC